MKEQETNEIIIFDESKYFNFDTQLLYNNGCPVEKALTGKAFVILKFLAHNSPCLKSKDEIYERCWGLERIVGDESIKQHIKTIRTYIGDIEISTRKYTYIVAIGDKYKCTCKITTVPTITEQDGKYLYSIDESDVSRAKISENDINDDFILMLNKANEGDCDATFEVACMYLYGLHSLEGPNLIESSNWLKKLISSLERKNEITDELYTKLQCARSMLANLYYSGSVACEEQSFLNAIKLLKEITLEPTNESYFELSLEKLIFMMTDGVGMQFDLQGIISCFEKYQDKCTNNAKNNIAKFYMRYNMYDKAVKILESIKESYPDVEYKLGIIYLQGLHASPHQPDVYRAEHYLTRAADAGHLDALHALGLMNFRGQYGYQQNMKKAREYFSLAAFKGHKGAQYDYAWMCKYGLGGECNISDSLHYFEESANKGHVLSMIELVGLYQSNICADYKKAFEWAYKAASSGEPQSEFMLGNLYYLGRGCEPDQNKAILWYEKALKHGCYQAKIMLNKIKIEE